MKMKLRQKNRMNGSELILLNKTRESRNFLYVCMLTVAVCCLQHTDKVAIKINICHQYVVKS